jgi:L-lactate dehydrogenase complex protein LldG
VSEELVTGFAREAEAVGAGVVRATGSRLVEILARRLEGARVVVAAAGLEGIVSELRSRGLDIRCDDGSTGEAASDAGDLLPEADAGLSLALGAVADSGTVVVGPGSGLEGVVAILPPHHVVVLYAHDIEPDLAAALEKLAPLIAAAGSRLAFITGPSRTSDIELTPVVGVHGPLRLDIVIVDG